MIEVLQPPDWVRPKGYANGVKARGSLVFTSGQLGWNPQGQLVSDDYVEQAAQALRNIVAVLAEAGAKPEHIVRLTWYVADRDAYFAGAKQLGALYRDIIGHYHATMSAFQVVKLMPEGAKVQIEATAVVPE